MSVLCGPGAPGALNSKLQVELAEPLVPVCREEERRCWRPLRPRPLCRCSPLCRCPPLGRWLSRVAVGGAAAHGPRGGRAVWPLLRSGPFLGPLLALQLLPPASLEAGLRFLLEELQQPLLRGLELVPLDLVLGNILKKV